MGNCEDELKSLESFLEYSRFDASEAYDKKSSYCDSELTELYKSKHFHTFCHKFTRNFSNLVGKWNKHKYNNDSCEYLNYWTYNQLINNNFNVDENDLSKSQVIKDIKTLWNIYSDFYPSCKLKNYKMNTSHFKYMKELHDYSQNYLSIKEKRCLSNKSCKTCYCTYINGVVSVYSAVQEECQLSEDRELCTFFRTMEQEKNPTNLLQEMKCNEEGVDDFLPISQRLPGGPHGGTYMDGEGDEESSLEGSPSRAGLNAGLSILGISLISFFLMYKFTPFQSWLHTVIRRLNRNKYFADNEETDEMLPYSLETENADLQNTKLNISYNPSLNF
ncbi:PIR Superfamily Protein [Plasmodium ovale wallikeri]|uniref:PIR Superfamily Protein n=2 Tax=Plasmodium ovale TaxID=36330 RepID=A0A1A9AR57_PLAOA|nr:PIR Superfamily Protein [Plasmodium ovale wallikeri]SBT58721.1 PIR Superfamily Protein [Plasmodium ovale wallikeri]SBT74007.1 PIR protein [Plasmodium ovale]